MMQAMPELVEQGDDFVVREQRRLCSERGGEIAIQVGDGGLYAGMYAPARYRIVHPSAAALRWPRINVEIKLPYQRTAAGLDRKESHVIVPNRGVFGVDL